MSVALVAKIKRAIGRTSALDEDEQARAAIAAYEFWLMEQGLVVVPMEPDQRQQLAGLAASIRQYKELHVTPRQERLASPKAATPSNGDIHVSLADHIRGGAEIAIIYRAMMAARPLPKRTLEESKTQDPLMIEYFQDERASPQLAEAH